MRLAFDDRLKMFEDHVRRGNRKHTYLKIMEI